MKTFAITGVAGYIAPRHLQAIKETGNHLVAALDPHDSVGILDRYFSDVSFFTEFERFDRHLDMLRRHSPEKKMDYLSICSPNNLHDAHIRFALRMGANTICEKPLVLNPWNLDALQEIERESGRRVFNVLQLRVHPTLVKLKTQLDGTRSSKKHEVSLTYVTSRGPWYLYSWKGDAERSGGVGTNIGVHFFDLLMWLFGGVQKSEVHLRDATKMSGFMELLDANVTWYLSIDRVDLPLQAANENKSTYRSIVIDGAEIEFSEGFTDLHTEIYRRTLEGKGFGIEEARPSIELVYNMRTVKTLEKAETRHPLIKGNKST